MLSLPASIISGKQSKKHGRSLIVLTPTGWIAVGVLFAITIPSLWLQKHAGVHLGLAIAFAFILSHFWCHRVVARIQGRWLLPGPVHAGDEVAVGAMVQSAQGAGPVTIALSPSVGHEGGELARLSGLNATPTRLVWNTRFLDRGLNVLPRLSAECTRPFGLMQARKSFSKRGEILVLPHIGRITDESAIDLQTWLDAGATSQQAGQDEISHLRNYRYGDSRRAIHWRASARAKQLLVTERVSPLARRLTIVLDTYCKVERSRRFERLVAVVATLVDHFISHGWEVSLRGPWAGPAGIVGDRAALLEALALVAVGPEADLLPHVPKNEPSFIFSLMSEFQPPEGIPCRVFDREAAEKLVHLGRQVG